MARTPLVCLSVSDVRDWLTPSAEQQTAEHERRHTFSGLTWKAFGGSGFSIAPLDSRNLAGTISFATTTHARSQHSFATRKIEERGRHDSSGDMTREINTQDIFVSTQLKNIRTVSFQTNAPTEAASVADQNLVRAKAVVMQHERFHKKTMPIFGTELEKCLPSINPGREMPLFLEKSLVYLMANLKKEYLVQTPIDPGTEDRWRQRVEKYCSTINFEESSNPYIVMNLLKVFFCELPHSLILPKSRDVMFKALQNVADPINQAHEYTAFTTIFESEFKGWSKFRQESFLNLFFYFAQLSSESSSNHSTQAEIARIFGPVLVAPRTPPSSSPAVEVVTLAADGNPSHNPNNFEKNCQKLVLALLLLFPKYSTSFGFSPSIVPTSSPQYENFRLHT